MGEPFFGNATTDHFGRGWVLGSFVEPAGDVRATGDVEVKWSSHPGGSKRPAWTEEETRTTASFLVSGHFLIHLSSGTFTLRDPGDYLVWGEGVTHSWEAVEDSVVMTVRWPSRPAT